MAASLNFSIEQGSDFERVLRVTVNGIHDDLSDSTFSGQIKKYVTDSKVLANFTFEPGDDATRIVLKLPGTASSEIPVKAQKTQTRTTEMFCYDIERIHPDGKRERILEGTIELSPEVTKDV